MAAGTGAALLVAVWAVARPLWLDEEMIAINLRDRGIADYLQPLWLGQSAPFGWLVVQHAIALVFGTGERALRFLPVLSGLLTIVTALWVGRRWLTTISSVVLALLCSCAQWLTFYFAELKPYAGDAWFGLLLPALGAHALAARDGREIVRRAGIFWIVAAIGHWFANGALLITPGCAAVLMILVFRRCGWRAAWMSSRLAIVWLVSFGVHYAVAFRHTASSPFLHGIWAFAFPPVSKGALETLRWFGARLPEFGAKPGSARVGIALWVIAVAGFAFAGRPRRVLAIMCATVPLSAIALAVSGLVPFFERLTLWIVPALYVGVAVFADEAVRLAAARTRHRAIRVTASVAALAIVALLTGDIAVTGFKDGLVRYHARQNNRGLDDRAGVRWLAARMQPGDQWVTTRYGVVAVWWYAGTDQPILQVGYQPLGSGCHRDDFAKSLPPASRLLVYLGFRFDDVARGFDDLFVNRLSRVGLISGYRPFAMDSYSLIVDRRIASAAPATLSRLRQKPDTNRPLDGCLEAHVPSVSTFLP